MNYVHSHHRQNQYYYRNEIISHLDSNYHLLSHICQNLELYMRQARDACKGQHITRALMITHFIILLLDNENWESDTLCVDKRFCHTQQLMARLDFVRFVHLLHLLHLLPIIIHWFRFALKDGQLWLGHQQALMVITLSSTVYLLSILKFTGVGKFSREPSLPF